MKRAMAFALIAMLLTPAFARNPLRGTHRSMVYQNKMADRLNYSRLHENQLKVFKKKRLLVRLPRNRAAKVDRRLPAEYRWCRPRTRAFVVDLSKHFYDAFKRPLQINSAVRTVEYQKKLLRKNKNAARGATKLTRSSHLTGATIDITKKGLSATELNWLRLRLKKYELTHMIEVTEEFRQSVFHIMVIRWRT